MSILGIIVIIGLGYAIWDYLPDKVTGFIMGTFVVVILSPLAPGAFAQWVMEKKLGFRKDHWLTGLVSVVFMIGFWCGLLLLWSKAASS